MQADTHSILLPQHMMMSVRKCAHKSQLPEVEYSHVRQAHIGQTCSLQQRSCSMYAHVRGQSLQRRIDRLLHFTNHLHLHCMQRHTANDA